MLLRYPAYTKPNNRRKLILIMQSRIFYNPTDIAITDLLCDASRAFKAAKENSFQHLDLALQLTDKAIKLADHRLHHDKNNTQLHQADLAVCLRRKATILIRARHIGNNYELAKCIRVTRKNRFIIQHR